MHARRVLALASALALTGACARPAVPPPPPHAAQTRGTLIVAGLHQPVTVARDRWGIPHITAADPDDLFFAQGFVQAQDRLFQMDLWRRSVQGRLSEVLGANFIDRDAMTRRVQFRGNGDGEWASYSPDTHGIAASFTRGINAWVSIARNDVPEEFVLAGWQPEYWRPEDLLNRTDAVLASSGAQDELLRARLVARLGAAAVDRLLPLADRRSTGPTDVDLSAINFVVGDVLRRIGTPPFFTTLARPPSDAPRGRSEGSNAWVIGGAQTASGKPLLAADPHRPLEVPSVRYLVHLSAPGWNVAGATAPWLPGVVIGHNDRVAWAMTAWAADSEDIIVERVNPANPRQVQRDGRWADMTIDDERIAVKGRAAPFQYERWYTSNGVVIAVDNQRRLAYTLRWSGAEPGGAGELAALALDRTASASEFEAALPRWRMPTAEFVYADIEGHIGGHRAGLLPRRSRSGDIPQAGWTGSGSPSVRLKPDATAAPTPDPDAARQPDAAVSTSIAVANGDRARLARITTVLGQTRRAAIDDMQRLQLDVVADNASRLLPLLASVRDMSDDAASLRRRLETWDLLVTPRSGAAALYVRWEQSLARLLASRRVPSEFVSDVAARLDVVALCEKPGAEWFDSPVERSRDRLLVDALIDAGRQQTPAEQAGVARDAVTFTHPLAVFETARRRFNVGPFPLPGYPHTVFATDGRNGPSFRAIFDLADWDRAVVINAPGQSGSPASRHYDDLAARWADGEYVPLPFSPEAVRAVTGDVLVLTPRR